MPHIIHVSGLRKFTAFVSTEAGNGRRQRAAGACGERATLTRGGWPDGPFSNIARKNFSVFTWLWPNLVHLLGVPVDDRQPILKKIRQF